MKIGESPNTDTVNLVTHKFENVKLFDDEHLHPSLDSYLVSDRIDVFLSSLVESFQYSDFYFIVLIFKIFIPFSLY